MATCETSVTVSIASSGDGAAHRTGMHQRARAHFFGGAACRFSGKRVGLVIGAEVRFWMMRSDEIAEVDVEGVVYRRMSEAW